MLDIYRDFVVAVPINQMAAILKKLRASVVRCKEGLYCGDHDLIWTVSGDMGKSPSDTN